MASLSQRSSPAPTPNRPKGTHRLQGVAQDLLESTRCANEVLEQLVRPTHHPREVPTVCKRKVDGVSDLGEAVREVPVDGPSARRRQRFRLLLYPLMGLLRTHTETPTHTHTWRHGKAL